MNTRFSFLIWCCEQHGGLSWKYRESIRAVELWNCGIVEMKRQKKLLPLDKGRLRGIRLFGFFYQIPPAPFSKGGELITKKVFSSSHGAAKQHGGLSWKYTRITTYGVR